MSDACSLPAGRSPRVRSRVSNGKDLFLESVDGRSALARRLRDILAQLVSDIGGDPSEAQGIIARRAATLAVWCEQAESGVARGEKLDGGDRTTSEDQPHAKQITNAPQPSMWGPVAEGEPVPGNAERPMPNARRKVTRRPAG